MAKAPKQVKLLKNAAHDHPEAFAYARERWESEGEDWSVLELTAFEKTKFGEVEILIFALYPKGVREAFARGERPNPYKWIAGELPIEYTESDFEGGADLGNGWATSGIDVVHE